MTVYTPRPRRMLRRLLLAAAAGTFALCGCKMFNKEGKGLGLGQGVSRPKANDPLLATGPNLIPKQNVPVPDRGIPTTKPKEDPLTKPVKGEKIGYADGPDRFQGVHIPGKTTTPAALAGRKQDGEELKIDDTPGVPLTPAGGAVPAGGGIDAGRGVDPLLTELEKYGVRREDRALRLEDGKYVFRALVPISGNGARREYVGVGPTAADAVRQVLDQVQVDRK